MSEIIKTYKGKPLFKKETGLITGDVPAICIKHDGPSIKWHGSKFPKNLLLQTVSFARHITTLYNGECQWRLAHNKDKDEWAVIILNQYISRGMTSDENFLDGELEKALASLGKGWRFNGTGHSHCDIDAFMSGTDKADEEGQSGFHYTVGKLLHDEFHLHCRYSFRGVLYEFEDNDIMFEKHDRSTKNLPDFPREWLDKLEEKKIPVITYTPRKSKRKGTNPYHHQAPNKWGGSRWGQPYTPPKTCTIAKADFLPLKKYLEEYFDGFTMQEVVSGLMSANFRYRDDDDAEPKESDHVCSYCGFVGVENAGEQCDDCSEIADAWELRSR